jgi:hypothetical protein
MANNNRADQQISTGLPGPRTSSSDIPYRSDMSAPSPVDQYGNKLDGSAYGSSGQSDSGKSPLSMSLGFLKTLTEKKSTRGMWQIHMEMVRIANLDKLMDNNRRDEDQSQTANQL